MYHTWSYGAVHWGENRTSRIVLKRGGEIVAMTQAAIRRVPIAGAGIAYVPWGPIWRRRGRTPDEEVFRAAIRSLRHEYARKRGLLLRMTPGEPAEGGESIRAILEQEGFRRSGDSDRTILVDLRPPLEEIRRKLSKQWKFKLGIAEKKDVELIEGTDDGGLYDRLCEPYRETLIRKKFIPGSDIEEYRAVQKGLPVGHKMRIMVCLQEGQAMASLMASFLGSRGILIAGGNNERGMRHGFNYLLIWRMIERMKGAGLRWCDLGGYNPERNPGTAHFKAGLPGVDTKHIGTYECCETVVSKVAVGVGSCLLQAARDFKSREKSIRNRFGFPGRSMSNDVFDAIKRSGYRVEATDEARVRELLEKPISCYVGMDMQQDPAGEESRTLLTVISHLQKAGHQVYISLCLRSEGQTGDPVTGAGRSDANETTGKMSCDHWRGHLSEFIDIDRGSVVFIDEAYWMEEGRYRRFLKYRKYCSEQPDRSHARRSRLNDSVGFIETDRALDRGYDFWLMYNMHDCLLQIGNREEWSDIVAGCRLIRRVEGISVQGMAIWSDAG
ncbi:MAG TPA: GNAT family N-acetyltransferase [Syntrophales bacterium]|nr:GNAT family N-acetyltransferase [Syntrophales bacterium]